MTPKVAPPRGSLCFCGFRRELHLDTKPCRVALWRVK